MLTVDKLKKSFSDASELKDTLLSSQLVTRDLFVHFKDVAHIIEVVSAHDKLPLIPHFLREEAPLSERTTQQWTREGASILVLRDGTEHLVAGTAGDVAGDINLVRRVRRKDANIHEEDDIAFKPFVRFLKIEIVPDGP